MKQGSISEVGTPNGLMISEGPSRKLVEDSQYKQFLEQNVLDRQQLRTRNIGSKNETNC